MTLYTVSCDDKIYYSKQQIRDAYVGVGIRGRVIIRELEVSPHPHFTKSWEGWGYISDAEWTLMEEE